LAFIRKCGAKPFLTDTNTLYVGQRGESVSHSLQAAAHGYDPNVLGAPVIIADGLKSGNERAVPCPGRHFEFAYLGGDIVDADMMVTVSHFKGHDLAGFGGAIKNVGMGCATRKGKMQQHCGLGPAIHPEHCTGCGQCVAVCSHGALTLDLNSKISIDRNKCAGCAACFLVCRSGGLEVDWRVDVNTFLERMAEYAAATLLTRSRRTLHLSFIQQVSPGCDCTGFSDAPICPDLGLLASWNPVALDQACLDMVNQALGSISLFVMAIGGISLIVAAVSIFNVMLMSVSERIKEIGILRSIGVQKHEISLIFLYEAVILGVAGSFVGALVSLLGGYLLISFMFGDTTFFFAPQTLVYIPVGMGIGIGVCLLSGVYPALRAARLNPIEALGAE